MKQSILDRPGVYRVCTLLVPATVPPSHTGTEKSPNTQASASERGSFNVLNCYSQESSTRFLDFIFFFSKQKLILTAHRAKRANTSGGCPAHSTWRLPEAPPHAPYLLSLLLMYSWNQVLNSPSWCWARLTTCEAASRSPQRMQ